MYAAAAIIHRWPLAESHGQTAWLCASLFYLLQLVGPIGDRTLFAKMRRHAPLVPIVMALDWLSYLAFGIMSILVAYGLAADIFSILYKWLVMPADADAFDLHVLYALVAATAATVVIGVYNVHTPPRIRRVDVHLANLPAAFDGFTIAQMSDLHVGPTIKDGYTKTVADMTMTLKPDIIALTGDFIDGTVADLAPDIAPLDRLYAPDGVYFVTGNHEYYWNAHAWSAEFTRLGARVLENEHVVIRRGDDAIVVAGVTDLSAHHFHAAAQSDPHKALQGAPENAPRILLAHQPNSYKAALAAGVDLQLSGHAHGGQYFPFTLMIGWFQRYYKGLNRLEKMWIYVSPGTGYWGPPLRAGAKSEITLLTLRRSA